MGDKKKYIIAIVLFVFLGLMVFTFANPSDEEQKLNGNGDQTEEKENQSKEDENANGDNTNTGANNNQLNNVPVVAVDNSYDLALEAVINAEDKIDEESYDAAVDLVNKVTNNNQKQELETRLEEVKNGIDAKALVEELSNKVEGAHYDEELMNGAKDFRDDEEIIEKVEALANEELKEELLNQLKTLALLLEDDTEPTINITDGEVLSKATEILVENDEEFMLKIQKDENGDPEEIENGYTAKEGTYLLTVVEKSGRRTTVAFTIDLDAPVFNVENKSHSENNIDVVITDDTFKYVEIYNQDDNSKTLSTNNTFTLDKEATYRLTAYDEAGHKKVIWVAIDKSASTITGVENNKHYGKKVKELDIIIEDKFLTNVTIIGPDGEEVFGRNDFSVGKNKEDYTLNYKATKEGIYTIVATDKVGKTSSVTFTIDRTSPIITDVIDGGYYKSVTPGVIEENFKNATLKLNGEHLKSYKVGDTLTKEGTYTLVVTDKAMNKSNSGTVITFVVDNSINVPAISYSTTEPTNKMVTVTLTADEEVEVLNAGTWNPASGFNTVFKKAYPANTTQTVTVRDRAGNETTVDVVITNIDKEKPKPVSTTYSTSAPTNGSVKVTIRVNEELKPVEGWTLSEDRKAISREFAKNVNGNVTISDLAGNTVVRYYSIKNIDKEAPIPTVTTSNNNGNWSTNNDVTATLTTNEKINTPEGWTVVTEGTEFTKVYTDNEKVSFYITDLAGNEALVKFEVKRIDKVAPVVTVVDPNKYQIEVGSKYIDKGYSAWDVVDKDVTHLIKITYQFQAKGTSNWASVDSLDTNKLGTYKITYTAYDKAGNSSKGTRVVQIVDTILPTIEPHSYVGKAPHYSQVSFKLHDNHLVDKFTINGDEYDRSDNAWSDANYENIKGSLKNGENVFVLYDVYGNTTEYKFNLDLAAPTITVKDSKVDTLVLTEPSFSISDNNLIDKFTVNGNEFDRSDAKHSDANYSNIKWALKKGENEFVLYDTAGNSTKLTFVLASNGTVNVSDDINLVNKPFYNEVGLTKPLTINGNGKTVTQEVTSADKFNWVNGNRTTMGNLFTTDNGELITVNNLTFAGTTQTISLGQYINSKSDIFNTEFNKVNVIGLKVVSFASNISPAVVVYGTATFNDSNIYGTKLSNLDTDPKWPVYDLAVVNYTNTTINGGKIGSIVTWNHISLTLNNTEVDTILTSAISKSGIVVNEGSKVNLIDLEDVADGHRVVPKTPIITINSGAVVDTLDLRNATNFSKVTIKEGATVNKIITDAKEMTLEEWLNEYK